eukprot:Blabericola_migrator_1__5515@NODE_2813_length_2325_cov_45_599646_g1763_i0_p1_GENE_NODE_2813_length_2325_cov_45_599646_g1763_i0NODE_2813_length_2325_cov_45_599646_g1763_i0_p1_ORF_typecomplete_len147_score16_82_NODE_2813_length_2325_cov_45_599646_g1763_i018002240
MSTHFNTLFTLLNGRSSPDDDIVKTDSTTTSKSLSSSSNSKAVLSILYTLTLVLSRPKNILFTMGGPSVPNQRTILDLSYTPSYLSSFLGFKAQTTRTPVSLLTFLLRFCMLCSKIHQILQLWMMEGPSDDMVACLMVDIGYCKAE